MILGALYALAGGLEDQIFLGLFAAHDGGGVHNCVDDGLIAGAAAQVAGLVEPLADFFAGGVGVLLQQHLGADYEAGGAEAALSGAVGHPRDLQRMHVADSADTLDGGDLRVVADLAHLDEAGPGHFAVQNDVAGAALALAAADLAAGEQQALTQHGRKRLAALNQHKALDSVDHKWFFDHTVSSCLYCFLLTNCFERAQSAGRAK
jgi:hypothetical protein